MFAPAVLLAFVLALPYAFFWYKVVLINLATCLFNIGINSFIVFYFAVLNKERLDLSKSSAFNWQGVGASKFVMMFPLFLAPILCTVRFYGYHGVGYFHNLAGWAYWHHPPPPVAYPEHKSLSETKV